MAKDFDQSIRSDLSTKQSQIKVVAGREPSIAELTENKPVMRYVPGTGLMMYVRYNNKRYHVKFSDDPRQEGKIRVEDVGSMEHITDSFIGPGQGGTGKDLSGSTGAISISQGTVNAGTLPISVGGTSTTSNTSWINSNITTNANGTLNYDGTTATAPSLPSISGTLTIAKGGTSATNSDGWLNSRITTNANGTLNYDATSATAPNIENIAGTLTVAKGGTGETDSNAWLNSRVKINANGTLSYDNSTTGAVTMNTLADANDIRSRVTAGLASNGDVDRTVGLDKGGLGADVSSSAGFVKLGSGSASIRDADDTKSDLSLNNVANERQINTFAQDGVPTSVAAGDIWVDTNDDNKIYRAASAGADQITGGEWVAVQAGKTAVGLGNVANVDTRDLGNMNAGTLAIARGGTNATDSDGWLNSRITTKADGTLNYDGTTAAAPNIANIGGTLTIAKGGTGATDSDSWLNSRVTTNADGTLNYDATSATAPNIANISGTLTVAKGGTGSTDSNSWLNSRVQMNTDGSLNYSASGSGAVTMNTLTDANNIRARVTGSLASGNGLNSGVAIGDAVQSVVIYNGDRQEARDMNDETISNSLVWEQDDTTEVIKIAFNYLHNSNNRGLKLSCLLRTGAPDYEARAKLSVYANTVSGSFTSGSTPLSGSPITSVVLATNKIYFDSTHSSNMLTLTTGSSSGQLTDGTLYKVTIGLYNEHGGTTSYLSAPTVSVFGST